MGKTVRLLAIFILVSALLDGPCLGASEIDWTILKQLKLDEAPLDISASADGKWIYILTPGKVLVYSIPEDKVMNRVPVDPSFDALVYSATDNTLALTSQSGRSLEIIQLETINKFDNSGLAFRGPENAPVTVAVFSDYQ